jgi:hypothetical protein
MKSTQYDLLCHSFYKSELSLDSPEILLRGNMTSNFITESCNNIRLNQEIVLVPIFSDLREERFHCLI